MTSLTAPTQKPARAAAVDPMEEILMRVSRHRLAGRADEGLALLDAQPAEISGHFAMRHERALCLSAQGKTQPAVELLRDCLLEQPQNPILLTDLGVLLSQSREREEGLKYLRAAVEAAPNYELAQANLGAALLLAGKHVEAMGHLGQALALEPGLVDAAGNYAMAALHLGQVTQAVDALYRALSADPGSTKIHALLSRALFRAERHDSALHHAQRALALTPNAREVELMIAQIYASSGRMDEAADLLLKLAEIPALHLQAVTQLILLRKTTAESPEAALLSQLAERAAALEGESSISLHMAIGKAQNDLGNAREAFAEYRQGNDVAATLMPYDAMKARERADRLRAFAGAELLSEMDGGGHGGPQPVFITGLPRSGTTLTEQMLSRHSAITAGGEMRAALMALGKTPRIHAALEERLTGAPLSRDDFASLGEAYEAEVRKTGLRTNRFTDKMPANYLYIGLLARALPDARFLILHRHPLDVILSNYMQNFGHNQPMSHRLEDLAETYVDFRAMAAHWTAHLPRQVLEFHYEDLVADREAQMRRILGFLDLDWQAEVLDHIKGERPVVTASVTQVREPIYTRAVRRWAAYAEDLRPAAEIVSPWLNDADRAIFGLKT